MRGEFGKWDKYLENCLENTSERYREIISFNHSSQNFDEVINTKIKDENTKNLLTKVLNLKYKNQFNRQSFIALKEVLEIRKNEKDKSQRFFSYQNYLHSKEISSSTFLGPIVRMSMALDNGNKAWAKREIESMSNMNLYELAIDLSILNFKTEEEISEYKQLLLSALSEAVANFPEEFLLKVWLVHLNDYFKNDEIDKLKSQIGAKWSLANVREFVQSKKIGSSYPGPWFLFLSARTSIVEVNSFLDSVFNQDTILNFDFSDYWPFLYYVPKSESIRNQIWSQIEKVRPLSLDAKSRYEDLLQIELLGLGYNKVKATQLNNELKRPSFQLRREYFKYNLDHGISPLWSIYELLKMGEISDEMIVWLI